MISSIKKCIDEDDIKGLRYIFLDSLDVDPTFEKYKDDYDICKKIDGFFERYEEIRPLLKNHSEWNMDYWLQLKYDLKKNFSEKRFEHMIEVAKVANSEKIDRLMEEREAREAQNAQVRRKETNQVIDSVNTNQNEIQSMHLSTQDVHGQLGKNGDSSISNSSMDISESDKHSIKEAQREIQKHNQQLENERLKEQKRIEEKKRQIEKENAELDSNDKSKKALGIVLVIMILIVAIVLLLKIR